MIYMGALALNTKKIKMGTGVASMYIRNPAMMASQIATVDEISGGRAVLGIGAGDKTLATLLGVVRRKPVSYWREYVTIIRKLLTGEEVVFKGEFFNFNKAKLEFKPKHKIPIWLGARGPKMLQMGGAIADGVLIDCSNPKDIEWSVKMVRKGAKDAGRNPDEVELGTYTIFSTSPKDPKAARYAAATSAVFIGTSQPDFVYERHGIDIEKDVEPTRKLLKEKRFEEAFRSCSDILLEIFSLTGSPKYCRGRMQEILDLNILDRVVFGDIFPDVTETLNIIAKEIVPELKY
jgi:5,10-methylenetetrahydromethanopterin reductase